MGSVVHSARVTVPSGWCPTPDLDITSSKMDITAFIHNARQEALLLGDYNAYRAQCSRRLATIRKQLGRSSKRKYTPPVPLTPEDLSKDPK